MARNYTIPPFHELRLVTHDFYPNNVVIPTIKLLNTQAAVVDVIPSQRGAAEIYGRELVPDAEYTIEEGEKLAVYTWTGCSIQVKGSVAQEYEGSDHAMKEYLNVMNALNAERELATINRVQGPRVLITGSPSSGKSSVSMVMCNYAVRSGWSPLFVEADPRASTDKKPLQFYPGTIGASVISSVTDEPPENPLVYFYGHTDMKENEKLYIQVSHALAATVELMMEEALEQQPNNRISDEVNDMGKYIAASGIIINAPFSSNRDLILQLAKIYNVSMILVIDSPSTHQELVRAFDELTTAKQTDIKEEIMKSAALGNLAFQDASDSPRSIDEEPSAPEPIEEEEEPVQDNTAKDVLVLAVNKLEGVVPVDHDRLKYLNTRAWKRYFDRPPGEMHNTRFAIDNLNLVFIDTSFGLSKDALPTDDAGKVNKEEIYASPWTGDPVSLINSILAIPATDDIKLIPYCNIIGFVLVKCVEEVPKPGIPDEEEDPMDTEFVADVICPSVYSPSAVPPYLLVPGNLRSMKLQTL
ncbi:cleavage/polyadenylation factor IA subunit clp1p like protein [Babesia gibsoni]|uniref:Cleavage/polyadenylation factor IA subunit clp1p like protein n=1 Tax=Babesia gibsoni TaxID=33632 RepID=A0AAD8PDX0_BABGI|nr:cleavage/polyadenylation factor IA subunit clp1p like protein [Babesia gibsoni]